MCARLGATALMRGAFVVYDDGIATLRTLLAAGGLLRTFQTPLYLTLQNHSKGAKHLNKHAKEGDTPLLAAAWNQNWEVNFRCRIPKPHITWRSTISEARMLAYPGHGRVNRGRR